MNRETDQTSLIIKIYSECVDLNVETIKGIPDEHFIWKPGGDSRSIAEIARHIIRVDKILLEKINIPAKIEDTFSNEQELIIKGHYEERDYIISLISSAGGYNEFSKVRSTQENGEISLKSTVIHIIHHHLYHYSQMVYLRRVHDRNWNSPEKKWEAVVDMINAVID